MAFKEHIRSLSENSILVRPLKTDTEYRAVEQLQREVWGMEEVEIVAHDLMVTVHKNGGLVLGAFDTAPGAGDRLVGFVFSFVGLRPDGRVKHCSHMAGVAPAYQGQDIGYRLKLAQREYVLTQGLDLITWTYEPLESRNAHFNLHKLGAVCNTYLPNVYGAMRDALNAGLPSDRFQVDWSLTSPRVTARLRGEWASPLPSSLFAQNVPLVNPPLPGTWLRPPDKFLILEGRRLLVQIPFSYQALKAADLGLARAWREHTRLLFETAFAAGYTATDLLVEDQRSYYLLEQLDSRGIDET